MTGRSHCEECNDEAVHNCFSIDCHGDKSPRSDDAVGIRATRSRGHHAEWNAELS
ncbi:MAG: hypothetical protein WCR69_03320 [Sulfuricurvum sp.]